MAGLRATDQDRDAAVETIEDAYAKGQLNDAERELRTQKALQATTTDELDRLVSDLKYMSPVHPTRTPVPTTNPAGMRILVAVIGSVVAGVLVIGVVIAAFSSSGGDPTGTSSFPDVSSPQVKGKLLSGKGLSALIKAVDKKFGTAVVSRAVIYPECASFTVPLKDDSRHTEDWYFRGRFDPKAQSTGNRTADDPLIDLGKVNVAALTSWVKKAGTELNVKGVTSTYLVFDERDNKPAMSVYVSNKFSDTGYASLNLDGSVIYVYKHT